MTGRHVVLTILAATFSISPASAQEGVELFGYFEPQLSAADLNGKVTQLASNKLRVDLATALSERASFAGNYIYVAYQGWTEYHLTDYLPDHLVSALPPGSLDPYVLEFTNRNDLDNACLRIAFEGFDLSLGKLQISPGSGYAWNPTDLFNAKDMLDPTYENPGHSAVQVDIPLATRGTAMLLYGPEENLEASSTFGRIKLHAGPLDVSLAGGQRLVQLTDFSTGAASTERRRLLGGDFAGELLGLGVWGEAAFNNMEVSDDYIEGLIGADYTFDSGCYLLNEFYVNEQGATDKRDYDVNRWMRFLTAERKTVTRAQWYLYGSVPATDLLSVGGSIITSLSDGSFVVVPTMAYNIATNLDLTLFGNIYAGEEGAAYSPKLGQGGLLRLRYYF